MNKRERGKAVNATGCKPVPYCRVVGSSPTVPNFFGGNMKEKSEIFNPCEWNPTENRLAMDNDNFHANASICVGAKCQYMLCEECANLPKFKRFKKRHKIIYNKSKNNETSPF